MNTYSKNDAIQKCGRIELFCAYYFVSKKMYFFYKMKLQPSIRSKDILKIVIPTPKKNILFALISFFFIFSNAFTPYSSRLLSNLFLYKIILKTPSAETNNPIIKAAYISLHKQFPFLFIFD
tara:strand:+ start:414 stop:779 length:366 start_codon:yes stop_codon:yes gene_type:complete